MSSIQILALRCRIFPLPIICALDGTQTKSFSNCLMGHDSLGNQKICLSECPNFNAALGIQKMVCKYSVVQKNSCMFEFPAFLPPTNLGLPMHSPSALTEHVSLNLARFFLLDPVLGPK